MEVKQVVFTNDWVILLAPKKESLVTQHKAHPKDASVFALLSLLIRKSAVTL